MFIIRNTDVFGIRQLEDMPYEEMQPSHEHINLLYLERYQSDEDWIQSSTMDSLLLQAGRVQRERGNLEDLYRFTMKYQEEMGK